jgi:hypothetical protein
VVADGQVGQLSLALARSRRRDEVLHPAHPSTPEPLDTRSLVLINHGNPTIPVVN